MGISSGVGVAGFLPAGIVVPFAGSSSPAGWLLCGGQAVSRTDYGSLFAVIGTTYGAGNGSTTFNLPDLRGRVVAGEDDMGGSTASRLTSGGSGITGTTLGATGGTETHTLTSAQMPSHTHTQDAHGHGVSDPTHTHGFSTKSNSGGFSTEAPARALYGADSSYTTMAAYSGVTVNNNTATNQNTGGGTAHQNTQPTIVLNYIIKAVAY